ncbi:unnamed protein product [Adineta ricciae]|uniref:Uncharacterized protein n=1 Tax=Adineta ricciae TaxID=249248 RepID=A0A816CV27_ADIRI|nr:unnamed protein product [Adineta ricciae]
MGGKCSSVQLGGDVHIPGNGNSAIIFNGVPYNISSIFNNAVDLVVQKYRFESIIIQFTSFGLTIISLCMLIVCLVSRRKAKKDIQPISDRYEIQFEMNIVNKRSYQTLLKELDRALQELEKSLLSDSYSLQHFAQPLEYIQDTYYLARSSPNLLSVVLTKLLHKKYAKLCLTILTMKNVTPCENSETWRSITCALNGLCCYMRTSSKLCFAAVDAGIIPILATVLSQRSYLDDLNTNTSVLHLFLMASRMFHSLAQIEVLRYKLEIHNCCEILLNMIPHTNNKLLRAINILTLSRIAKNGIHKISLTFDDSLMLFRLYYESVKSDFQEAYGLERQHILNGFYNIGQLDYTSYDLKNTN